MNKRNIFMGTFEEPGTPRSLYDPPDEAEDLWFLPDPDDALDIHDIPLPKVQNDPLVRPDEWIAAQGTHAALLARAALAAGQLDMVVAGMGPDAGQGALERLALREVEALAWAAGTPISLEEIGRDQLQARVTTDPRALQQARWAVRRLIADGPTDDLRGFLGLHRVESQVVPRGLRGRITGKEFDEAATEFWANLAALSDAHVFTQAAFARYLWRLSELSAEEDHIEGAVWAAKRMAQGCLTLTFVPMGQGARHPHGGGSEDLGSHFTAMEAGANSARIELQRLTMWRDRARDQTAFIKGTNPARIISALVAKPMATTKMIEQAVGTSRDTAERLLARMLEMGLVREVTGASRFRIWAAKI
ncbi:helix-turn-helix domain-containing protein [Ruegeria sp. EL01]|jgi:hypothetical protein|uniref:helix-turn-helix domain-containing protein n=1 Tax=Ruegeria sp. EL01 TaxID=2107578 RepID=UPI000EA81350|nr:helix-turn-helix domain-containing protein [Ruegeria sp. EL01]